MRYRLRELTFDDVIYTLKCRRPRLAFRLTQQVLINKLSGWRFRWQRRGRRGS